MDWILLLEKCIWFGFGALGFAILFNVPTRTLGIIWLLGALGGSTKTLAMHAGVGVVLATFLGAILVGVLSIWAAQSKKSPHLVFSIPSVIPMIPGVFAYRTMLGLMHLTGDVANPAYQQVLHETINYGLKALFILMSLAVGVSMPLLITRKTSAKMIGIPGLKRWQQERE